MTQIEMRQLSSAKDFDSAVELQKVYWGADAHFLVPRHMLHSLSRFGGHLFGAFDGATLVGILIGFIGSDSRPAPDHLLVMSKRLLVLPGYRGQNIGFRLKMAQRDLAIQQGIERVTWTFNPLLAPNAHLNLRKLGAIADEFKANYFDEQGEAALTADRLIAQWHVNSERVNRCAAGKPSRRALADCLAEGAVIVSPILEDGALAAPDVTAKVDDTAGCLVEIPSEIGKLEPQLARAWRLHIRATLDALLARGFCICDFISESSEGGRRAFYVLEDKAARG